MRKGRTNRKTKPQLFSSLPPEITADILSRLPIRNIGQCKCVCKSWLNLLRTREFADFHLPKSIPGLVIAGRTAPLASINLKIYEFDEEIGLQHPDDLRNSQLTAIESKEFIKSSRLRGSANGLLLLVSQKRKALYICNPITREYIQLPNDDLVKSLFPSISTVYGFGMSRITRKYKVVIMSHDLNCFVYVVGSGIWRSVARAAPFLYVCDSSSGVFVNGNLYWLVAVSDESYCVCCFDLETEAFSTFSLPPLVAGENTVVSLVALGDCLCVSDCTSKNEVVIWLMKGLGDEKTWTKEFVIKRKTLRREFVCDGIKEFVIVRSPDFVCECPENSICDNCGEFVHPIRVLKDGEMLMALHEMCMIYYSNKTKPTMQTDVFGANEYEPFMREAMPHTSSFLSLRSFPKERVRPF